MAEPKNTDKQNFFRAIAPKWLNDNVMGVVSGLKLSGGAVSFLSTGLGAGAGHLNPWRLTSAIGFMGTQGLGTAYAEHPLTPDEQAELDALNPTQYALRKLSYAFHPKEHIIESNGLLTIANGLLLVPAYFHEGNKGFYGDLLYASTNAVAGGAMMLCKDRQHAWQISSAAQLLAAPLQFYSFNKLMHDANPGVAWKGKAMMGSAALFTAANLTGLTLGHNKYDDLSPDTNIEADSAAYSELLTQEHRLKRA